MNKNSKFVGYFAVCFSIFIWGITFVCTKHLLLYFSALEILFIRFVMAYLMLSIMYPHKLKITKTESVLVALAGLTGNTLYQFTENLALNYTTASICWGFYSLLITIVNKKGYDTIGITKKSFSMQLCL